MIRKTIRQKVSKRDFTNENPSRGDSTYRFSTLAFKPSFKAGMSNWRPAGRMRPHCVFNAARNELLHHHVTEIYNKI